MNGFIFHFIESMLFNKVTRYDRSKSVDNVNIWKILVCNTRQIGLTYFMEYIFDEFSLLKENEDHEQSK